MTAPLRPIGNVLATATDILEAYRVSRYQKGKPISILLTQETVSGSNISWANMQVCTSLQTDNHASTRPLSFYRPDALPAPN